MVPGLSGTDKILPINLWYRLLDQSQITLNMLRPSIQNPNISAHTRMEGKFDFNKTPLVPPGTKEILKKNLT